MNLFDPLRDGLGIIDMKTEVVHTRRMPWLFRVAGIQDRQVYFAVREVTEPFLVRYISLSSKTFL